VFTESLAVVSGAFAGGVEPAAGEATLAGEAPLAVGADAGALAAAGVEAATTGGALLSMLVEADVFSSLRRNSRTLKERKREARGRQKIHRHSTMHKETHLKRNKKSAPFEEQLAASPAHEGAFQHLGLPRAEPLSREPQEDLLCWTREQRQHHVLSWARH
jgi:hypothetical protein